MGSRNERVCPVKEEIHLKAKFIYVAGSMLSCSPSFPLGPGDFFLLPQCLWLFALHHLLFYII